VYKNSTERIELVQSGHHDIAERILAQDVKKTIDRSSEFELHDCCSLAWKKTQTPFKTLNLVFGTLF
jgi:hypothetical protein